MLWTGGILKELHYRFLNSYTYEVIMEVINLVIELAPYLIGGILLSAYLRRYVSTRSLKKIFTTQHPLLTIVIASLLGIISPLGSYVVIPLSATLLMAGVPFAPLVAFMMASPLINPGLFMLTWGALGLQMALFRCLGALLVGISAGFVTHYAISARMDSEKLIRDNKLSAPYQLPGRTFWDETWRYTRFIIKPFGLGIIVAALTKVLIPSQDLADLLGQNTFLSILTATAAGVPLYSCGGATIPVMQELAEIGVDKGAILAFFISGPATKISNIAVMAAVYKKKMMAIYLFLSLGVAILLGLCYHFL